jgi:D-3-phosphoglycerate dehydrogenase / 2-oxoglutarate reductase
MKVLLTTTSFQDTPGAHHDLLKQTGWEIITARGPLNEADTLALVGEVDGYICGDDAITRKVLEKARPKLKVLSKYGIGVDKIDVKSCTEFGIPLLFTPGVNHITVAEHTFGLLLAVYRQIVTQANFTREGKWKRFTGHELFDKTIGVVGVGRIGKEVIFRAKAFGMKAIAYDPYADPKFLCEHHIPSEKTVEDLIQNSDIVTLHVNLTDENRHMINATRLKFFKKEAVLLNCARGELVDSFALADALNKGMLFGYGSDVLDQEPPSPDHPLFKSENTIITPHIGSRTYESVVRQATAAVKNLILAMNGEKPIAQVNPEVPVEKVV